MTRHRISTQNPLTHDTLRELIPWIVVALLLAFYTEALATALTR